MRIVAALGGNALLERGEPPESEIQEKHILKAVTALAPLAREHELVITHGNGPQVGLLALESAGDPALAHPYPLDVLGAQTQGMIGYWLVQALQNALPGRQVACLVSQTLVSAADPAFTSPSKLVGPVYTEQQAASSPMPTAGTSAKTARGGGASFRHPNRSSYSTCPSSARWRAPARSSLRGRRGRAGGAHRRRPGCAGWRPSWTRPHRRAAGPGPRCRRTAPAHRRRAVEDGFGTPHARPIHWAAPGELRTRSFPAGSMGPKVEAACRFVEATGKMAAIGQLADAEALLRRDAGTTVTPG